MTDENYEARAQAHLASLKRDMKASMEDAVVRAMHKVMAEFEAKSDQRLMEMPEKFAGFDVVVDASLPPGTMKFEQPAQRCPLCNYQHGHAIGCKNNPVDIALNKMAENARELGLDYEQPAQQEPGRNHWEDGDVFERIAASKKQPAQQEPVAWPAGLIERIKAAEQRIQYGHAPRRIPADPTDVDLVLAEVRYLLEGKQPPFWVNTPPPAQRKPLTHEQRVDLLAKFEAHKHEWHAPAILIDMVEAAHGIKGDA